VSAAVRRRRGLVLLGLALASGALAASMVHDRVAAVERRVGPLVPVAVAARNLEAGARLGPRDLAVRRVPQAYAPRTALSSPAHAVGRTLSAPLAGGSYLPAELLAGGARQAVAGGLRRGQRVVEIAVAGGAALESAAAPGTRVDVLVSRESADGRGSTSVPLENVELLALRATGAGAELDPATDPQEGAADAATAVATLRVTLRQAIYLTAAQNFAREVRLLPRPPGDRARAGGAGVGSGEL
jgi:pilus assembly protein CpaB